MGCVAEPTIGLHERERHVWRQRLRDLLDVVTHGRRQGRVQHSCFGTRDIFDQRAGLMRQGDLGEALIECNIGCSLFVLGVFPAMQKGDGAGRKTFAAFLPQLLAKLVSVQRLLYFAMHIRPLLRFNYSRIEWGGFLYVEGKDIGA